MSDGIRAFIKEAKNNLKLFGYKDVIVKDALPEHVDIQEVLSRVEAKVPFHIVEEIDCFYIGHFKEFDLKDINAMYKDGTIYITNDQDDIDDMVDDMIHEIAHAAEDRYAQEIYSDSLVQREFLGKRARLRDTMREYGFVSDADYPKFSELEYSKEFDDYLYNDVGEERLHTFCSGLFIRPYASTGVREYFATAFEEFLLGDQAYLKQLSPAAYDKVALICLEEV